MDNNCEVCNAYYTDLKLADVDSIPPIYKGRVKAIRLRKGCNLTTFSEEDFEGVSSTTDKDILTNYTENFGSYSCQCDDTKYEPKRPEPRSSLCKPEFLIVLMSIHVSGINFVILVLQFQGRNLWNLLLILRMFSICLVNRNMSTTWDYLHPEIHSDKDGVIKTHTFFYLEQQVQEKAAR